MRILVALVVLAGAIYLQYRLANIPLPVDVEKSKPPYTPATAALIKREELVVDQPVIDNSSGQAVTGILLSGDGTDFVAVEARFDSAQLGNGVMEMLRSDTRRNPLPKEDRQLIVYNAMVDEDAAAPASTSEGQPERQPAAPCRTSIQLRLAPGSKPLSELHFFQLDPGTDKHRNLEMRASDADLIVELLTRNFTDTLGEMQGANCGKTLEVGDWHRSFTAPAPIDIVVPAGASFRFSFTSAEGNMPWTSTGQSYEPFKLVALPVYARAIREVKRAAAPAAAGGATQTIFEARSADSGQLVLQYLRVGSEELQLAFGGQAMVQENGKYAVTFNLLEFAKANPILAGIMAMLDAALLEWIRRALFKGGKQ